MGAERVLEEARAERERKRKEIEDKEAETAAEKAKAEQAMRNERLLAKRELEIQVANRKGYKKLEKRVGDALDAEIEEELAHDSEDSTGALKPREVSARRELTLDDSEE